jgi:catalase
VRGKPEKFAEHYNQARLFFDSQSPIEKAHIMAAFRFELSKVTVPAIRVRTLSLLVNVSKPLAAAVAEGLGLEVPPAMPKALDVDMESETAAAPSLSLTALPGHGGIATRKVAILLAPGMDAAAIQSLQTALSKGGAVTRLLGVRLGTLKAMGGTLEVDATLENAPAVLFDGLILPDGAASLATCGQAVEFTRDQFRHCKTILALGNAPALLTAAGISTEKADSGLLIVAEASGAAETFTAALAVHRHFEREIDPPAV